MRIGIMLRYMDQHGGGVMVYTRNLLSRLFRLGSNHEFVLLYQNGSYIGTFSDFDNVRELHVSTPGRLLWDQLGVDRIARREKLDMLFNPKYSLPLVSSVPGVFVCHGLDWYIMPWGSRLPDRLSHKYLMPRYARSAAGIIAVSDTTRDHVLEHWQVAPERVRTVHHGVADQFFEPATVDVRRQVRREYRLPERYVLYVGQIYPAKNFDRLLRAYAAVGPGHGVHLVIAGGATGNSAAEELKLIGELGIDEWVARPGWIEQTMLPAFYAESLALLLPSLYESVGLPTIEAMAAGCPVLTSNRYGTREMVQDAAVLIDPENIEAIADGIERIITDETLRAMLVTAGRRRAQCFTWDRCARATLDFLEHVNADARPHDQQALR